MKHNKMKILFPAATATVPAAAWMENNITMLAPGKGIDLCLGMPE
jgi:hypothetical protein